MKNEFLLFTKITLNTFFAGECAQIKNLSFWTINRTTTLGFSVFIDFFSHFTFFFPRFCLLQFFATRLPSGGRVSEKA